ncbi:MAG TPA: recombinase family protein [Kineosporiaceae bacterium]|nr:recombinase family protein [Kineosporiaceae bacterium]
MARPLAYGYVSVPPGTPDEQAQRWQRDIATFVDGEGHDLAGLFTDVRGQGAPAFEAMSRALHCGAVSEVVVPRLDHLGHVPGFGPADVRLLSRYLHATVVEVEEPVGAGRR